MYRTKKFDKGFLFATGLLICIGFIIQYSASSKLGKDPNYFMVRHLMRIGIGIIIGLFFLFINYKFLKKISLVVAVLSIISLVAVLFFKDSHTHVCRWLPIGPIKIQPAEFAKFALIIYFATFFENHQEELHDFKNGFLPLTIVLFVFLFLIVLEPDFSTSAVTAAIAVMIMFIGGTKMKHLMIFGFLFLLFAFVSIIHSPYKIKRVFSYMNPEQDIQGAGYQLYQSYLCLGNGGVWGVGLGDSIGKNHFLPEANTDFIFAIFGEEFGFIGAMLLLIIFIYIFIKGMKISFRSSDIFGTLVGVGLSVSIFIYALINIGVVCGIFPVTGLPLPFISYGGSSMIYNFIAVGIVLNISRQHQQKINDEKLVIIND